MVVARRDYACRLPDLQGRAEYGLCVWRSPGDNGRPGEPLLRREGHGEHVVDALREGGEFGLEVPAAGPPEDGNRRASAGPVDPESAQEVAVHEVHVDDGQMGRPIAEGRCRRVHVVRDPRASTTVRASSGRSIRINT